MRFFNINTVRITFLFSLIFHIAILSMDINMDRSYAERPIKIIKIRYSPAVEESKKEAPVKRQTIVKRQKPAQKIAMPMPEIPAEKPRKVPKEIPVEAAAEMPVEKPKEAPKEIPVETAAEMPEKIPVETPEKKPVEKPKEIPDEIEEIVVEAPIETPVYSESQETYLPEPLAKHNEPVEASPVAATVGPEAMPEIKEISPKIDLIWIAEELRKRIEAIRKYPRMARRMGIEGTVIMTVEFDKMGELIDIHIKKSAGHRILDRDALSLVKRVSPLRHNAGRNIVIELPISYDLIER